MNDKKVPDWLAILLGVLAFGVILGSIFYLGVRESPKNFLTEPSGPKD